MYKADQAQAHELSSQQQQVDQRVERAHVCQQQHSLPLCIATCVYVCYQENRHRMRLQGRPAQEQKPASWQERHSRKGQWGRKRGGGVGVREKGGKWKGKWENREKAARMSVLYCTLSRILPAHLRASTASCACAACARGSSSAMRCFSLPSPSHACTSATRPCSSPGAPM